MRIVRDLKMTTLGARFNRRRALLKRAAYGGIWPYDFMETGEDRQPGRHRIGVQQSYAAFDRPMEVARLAVLKGSGICLAFQMDCLCPITSSGDT